MTGNKRKDELTLSNPELELVINFATFRKAFEVFSKDYGIVNHPNDPLVSIFDRPRSGSGHDDHKYTVTTVPSEMTEASFKEKINGRKLVVIDMCMDARGALNTYNTLEEKAKEEFGPDVLILLISHGGGIIQVDEAVRAGETVALGREKASRTIYGYLAKYENQVACVYAGGHDCRCGACAFYNDNVGVPEQLGVEKGSEEEMNEMSRLVEESATQIIPAKLQPKVRLFMSKFHLDDNDSVTIVPVQKK